MFKKILLATSLISLFTLVDAQKSINKSEIENKSITKFEFIENNRVMMYLVGIGLPDEFQTGEWDKIGISKKQKEVLKNICLNGKYDPNNGDSKYVSPLWADSLLEMYGWK